MNSPNISFQDAVSNPALADELFSRQIFASLIASGRYVEGFDSGIAFLQKMKESNEESFDLIHKGAAYFWLGIAAIFSRDFEAATFFIDAAAEEDIRRQSPIDHASTPAIGFLLIAPDSPPNIASPVVARIRVLIEDKISVYKSFEDSKQSFRINMFEDLLKKLVADKEIRATQANPDKKLKSTGSQTLASSLLTYFLEQSERAKLISFGISNGTFEPFHLNLLKGCILFESIMRFYHPEVADKNPKCTLGSFKDFLPGGDAKFNCTDFEEITSLADQLDENRNPNISLAYRITGKLRNKIAHSFYFDTQINHKLFQRLSNAITSSIIDKIAKGHI
ncbi:MAG: hypothetical protein JNK37_01325 [Verrucomicrobiales bacterium]|nr:hypothetical protein [Verrucomicrobiales bacterium]